MQHLRPDEDGGSDQRPQRAARFDRPRRGEHGEAPRQRARREPEVWLDAAPAVPEPAERTPEAPEREPEVWLDEPAPKPARRTIEIRGQVDRVHGVAPIGSPGPQRVRGRMAHERVGPRPDKIALWAVLLGLLLILVAAISSPGADAAALLLAAGL